MLKKRRKRDSQEMVKEIFRMSIISEYTALCRILESDGNCREKLRNYVLHELEHTVEEQEQLRLFRENQELAIGVDGLNNYKFSVLYQIISAGALRGEVSITNPLAAAKMISSMMAGWGLVKQTIDFSCYRKALDSEDGTSAGDEALVDSIFALMEEKGEEAPAEKGSPKVSGRTRPAIPGVPAILPGQRLD